MAATCRANGEWEMADMSKVRDTQGNALVDGKWYCIGFDVTDYMGDTRREWGVILQYDADNGAWYGDSGERVYLFDIELQMPVADDAADGYAPQN
jgi:hypothetical protein